MLKKYKLIWEDLFNRETVDESIWNIDEAGGGFGNNEAQYYSKDNVYIKDNMLHIVARKEQKNGHRYTSAKLTTKSKKTMLYGKIEVSAKIPKGLGTWPAIWLLPEDIAIHGWPLSGEIDLMEHVGHTPNQIHASLHSLAKNHHKGNQDTAYVMIDDANSTFKNYVLEWDENGLCFYVDDQRIACFNKPEIVNLESWPFDRPYYLILNLAIGGWWGGKIDDTIFPTAFLIKHVKVYERDE